MVVSPVSGLALMIADALLEEISPAKSQLLLEDGSFCALLDQY
jgi:hypothetical protein